MTLEKLKKCKDIMDKADISREVSYSGDRLVWLPDKGVVRVPPIPKLDILRDRLAMYGMSLIA